MTQAKPGIEWIFSWANALFAACAAYGFLQWGGTSKAAFATYDACKNLAVIDELVRGQYNNLFHHGAPLFYLLFWPLRAAGTSYAMLGVIQTALACVAMVAGLALAGARGIWLWLGMAVLATMPVVFMNSALFSIEGASPLFLVSSVWFMANARPKYMLGGIFYGLGLAYNYKLALAWPGLALFVLWDGYRPIDRKQLKHLGWFATGITIPLTALALAAPAMGLPWHRFPAVWAALAIRNANPEALGRGNATDWLFYPLYFVEQDNPLAWLAGLLAAGWVLWQARKYVFWPAHKVQITIALVLAAYTLSLIVLPKAPRVWVPILPLAVGLACYYTQAVWATNIGWKRSLLAVATLACLGLGISRFLQKVALYVEGADPSGYATVARKLSASENQPLQMHQDMGVYPYLNRIGQDSLIISHSCNVTLIYPTISGGAGALSGCGVAGQPIANAPMYRMPLLWLEAAEFTGLTYIQTMARRDSMLAKATVLWLEKN